jgi:hypothetical protein
VATELVSKALADAGDSADWEREPVATALLARALDGAPAGDLACRLALRQPVIAIGAPVTAYLPPAAERLQTGLVIPPHAEVANAVGAVAGGVVQQLQASIYPSAGGDCYRLHLPGGKYDFPSLDEAVAYARAILMPGAEAQARRAGADQVEVHWAREDVTAPVSEEYGMDVFIETRLTATATGRPGVA